MRKVVCLLTCATILSAQNASPAPDTITVHMKNIAFDPAKTTVELGQTVVFQNDDQVTHNVTDTDHNISSDDVAAGKSWRYTFTRAGDYHYACTYHAGMSGEIVVSAAK